MLSQQDSGGMIVSASFHSGAANSSPGANSYSISISLSSNPPHSPTTPTTPKAQQISQYNPDEIFEYILLSDMKSVEGCLREKPNAITIKENGVTTLIHAFQNKQWEILKFLLTKEIKPDLINFIIASTGKTILHLAVEERNIDITKLLLQKGADPNIPDKETFVTLYICLKDLSYSQPDKETMVKTLIEFHASPAVIISDLNKEFSLLHYAVQTETYLPYIKYLFQTKKRDNKDVNSYDSSGRTPLHILCELQSPELIRLILQERSVDASLLTKPVSSNSSETASRILHRMNSGMETSTATTTNKRKGRQSIYHIICERTDDAVDHSSLIKFCLDKNIDPNIENDDGETPLQVACRTKKTEIVHAFLDRKRTIGSSIVINVNKVNRFTGKNALHIACETMDCDIVKKMSKRITKVNLQDKEGRTAMHYAMKNTSA
jgi:ankyrin repeat protein